ncbi:MAG: hypothetical protein P4L76_01970 [Beijerinckiaceae bacterium]|nr:hypothetical protein [Beijerinckiaceae bacterium]
MQNEETAIYGEVPGGQALLSWFDCVPDFHDAEILSLHLNRKGSSVLRLHGWITTYQEDPEDRRIILKKHAVVTFTLDEIMDLQLDGFSIQNVIGGLILRRAPDRADRRNYLALKPLQDDIEIELEPCYGLSGFIRARSVTIRFKPGEPEKADALDH